MEFCTYKLLLLKVALMLADQPVLDSCRLGLVRFYDCE